MCLGIPGKIISIAEDDLAEVDFGGVRRHASLALLPGARPGDHVLVHVGFAIQKLEEKEYHETLEFLGEYLGPGEEDG